MSVNKIVTLDNLTEYTTKIKDYIDPLFISTLESILSLTSESSKSDIITAFGGQTQYDKFLSYASDKRRIRFGNLTSTASVEGNSIIDPINIHSTSTTSGAVTTQEVTVVIQILNVVYAFTVTDDGTDVNFAMSTIYDEGASSYLGELKDFSTQGTALNLNDLKPNCLYFIKADNTTQHLYLSAYYNSSTHYYDFYANQTNRKLFEGYITLSINAPIPSTISATTKDLTREGDFTLWVDTYGSSSNLGIFEKEIVEGYFLINSIDAATASHTVNYLLTTSTAQTISGVKTFSTLPESSVTPTTSNQLTNKNYVDTAISTAMSSAVKREIVQTLPVQDIKTDTIYMVPKSTAGTNDVYDEYMYINSAWELIGTTQVDLTNYLAKNNTTAFTPTADYNPATKKYVDDSFTYATNLEIDALFS